MPDDMRDLFSRDIDRIELPPPAAWMPGARAARRSVWSGFVAVPALAGVVLALVLVFVIQLARGDLPPQVAKPPSASPSVTTSAVPSATTSAQPTTSPEPSSSARLPASTAVQIDKALPSSGDWALILTRTFDTSPTQPEQAQGPARLPATDVIRAVPLTARATTQRDTLFLLSFTSGTDTTRRLSDNLLREQIAPDGHRLVLSVVVDEGRHPAGSSSPQARLALVVVDLVAGTVGALTTDSAFHDQQPAWSPAGDRIAFSRTTLSGQNAGLWEIRADGTGLHQILAPASDVVVSTGLASWNGDGSGVGFFRGFEESGYNVLDLAAGTSRELWPPFANSRGLGDWRTGAPAFVGAFAEGRGGGEQRLVTAQDERGNGGKVIVRGASAANAYFLYARWRPGSDEILYARWTADAAGQNASTTLYVTDASGRSPREIITSHIPMFAAWTPDGRDVVVLEGQGAGGGLRLVAPDGSDQRVVQGYGGIPEARVDWLDLAVLRL